uniref:Uncharacterized protein n=1 Tax=Candidatus Kentrum sp. LFY TaxID=2126342 RepID=A0A450US28_9GAMM|nr:MAG: hypothetical protein BECKLFY1418B_GA0070995_10698 [Candidatus Kentron sp. LFY]VFJ97381.1 MAG: hypothetical protein BECKLFY1418A_GA0070994_10698 [Candidatus Kentron sp. LFY]VFK20809.1 MAG: hypothetical protein BECKLFY1418C_GA0070996_10798 [Candidatus Kentron sp. LFY]
MTIFPFLSYHINSLPFVNNSLYARNRPPNHLKPTIPQYLPRTRLHSQIKRFTAKPNKLFPQLIIIFLSQLCCFHPINARVSKTVRTGNFAPARLNASRATSSSTPSISYNTRPGCTKTTQYSTLPFPLPWRTSNGFLVTGLSGKTRIHIFAPRLTCLVSARRAASI